MRSGRGAVLLTLLPYRGVNPHNDRAEIMYTDTGQKTWAYTHHVVEVTHPIVVPEPPKKAEPIREGDRVRHSAKVSSDFRRLGGRVMSVNVTGRSVVVLWDGIGSYREELVSQLEVVHRAEKVAPTPMEQIVQLLDTEIDLLQERLKALNAAKAALPC